MTAQAQAIDRAHLRLAGRKSGVKRQAKRRLKEAVRAGEVTLEQLCRERPGPASDVALVEVVRWLPRFGPSRQERLGAMASRQGVNLLVALGRASDQSCAWLVAAVAQLTGSDAQLVAPDAPDVEIARLRARIEKLTDERDGYERRWRALAEELAGGQTSLVVGDAVDNLRELTLAVRRHRETVTNPKSPGQDWAGADEALWAALDRMEEAA